MSRTYTATVTATIKVSVEADKLYEAESAIEAYVERAHPRLVVDFLNAAVVSDCYEAV